VPSRCNCCRTARARCGLRHSRRERVEEQQPAFRDVGGDGTSATSPSRRAPSSVSSTLPKTSLARSGSGLDDPTAFEADRNVLDESAVVGERLRARHRALDPLFVRRRKDLLGGDVGIADEPVLRREAPPFQVWPSARPTSDPCPARENAGRGRSARSGTRCGARDPPLWLAQAATGSGVSMREAAKMASRVSRRPPLRAPPGTRLSPKTGGVGHDGPVDGERRDQFERRAVGDRTGTVRPGNLFGVLPREEGRVVPANGEAGGAAPKSFGMPLISQPWVRSKLSAGAWRKRARVASSSSLEGRDREAPAR
jgi:hypothetical protein